MARIGAPPGSHAALNGSNRMTDPNEAVVGECTLAGNPLAKPSRGAISISCPMPPPPYH